MKETFPKNAAWTDRPTPDSEGANLGLIGRSDAMNLLRGAIRRLAPLPAPVLVRGDSGSGKELVARALHDLSPRAQRPFVAMNAGAVQSSLAASELFGHQRGAFTGATGRRPGLLVEANKGTLVLDEIAELPLDLQAWLLRTIENGEVRPLGADRLVRVDVRIIAATHVDLEDAVRCGRFRADLYYRLSVLKVRVPLLRERLEDIHVLAEHFLARLGLPDRYELSPEALQALTLHSWPGNVRELRSVLLRAAAFARSTVLDGGDVVRAIGEPLLPAARPSRVDPNAVALALAESGGNVTRAARRLGIPRSTLRHFLRSNTGRTRLVH
jgi:DNA-binding NtrC family response regulator